MSDLVRSAQSGAAAVSAPAMAPEVVETPPPRVEAIPRVRLGSSSSLRPEPAPTPVVDAQPSESAGDGGAALFAELQATLEDARDRARAAAPLSWERFTGLIVRVIDALAGPGELFWTANAPTPPSGQDYLAFHQARVAILSVRLGANVGYDRKHLVELGIAGCLIDVGLWQLPPALLRRLDTLSADEQALYRSHPRAGADIVRRWAPPLEGVVEAVLQHHEREQGQGFPQGLTGPSVHPYAKILGLIDTYTGLTAPASLRPGLRPHDAVREIVRSKNESFPAPLIKALLSEISVFPPGTLVRLNTGETGRVTAVNRNHPLRPRVEVYDTKGPRSATPKIIDLSEAPFLYITGPVAEGAR